MFLWNEKRDNIKRNTIINDYPNGGLKMIDIFSFNNKYLDEENRQGKCVWKLFDLALDRHGGRISQAI